MIINIIIIIIIIIINSITVRGTDSAVKCAVR